MGFCGLIDGTWRQSVKWWGDNFSEKGLKEKGKLWLRKTIQNAVTVLSEDDTYAEAVKTGGKYLCQLIMSAEKVSAELVKTAGKNHSILKQRLAVRN